MRRYASILLSPSWLGVGNSSRILLDVDVQMVRLQCDPWFGFVYSEDNISDLPSRGDFTLMESLGAEFRAMVFPQLRGYFRDDV